jgi:hypothetical protein
MPQIPSRPNTRVERDKSELLTGQVPEYLTNKRVKDSTVPQFRIDHPNGDYGMMPIDEMKNVITRLLPFNKLNNRARADESVRLNELNALAEKLGYKSSGLPGMTGTPVNNMRERIQKYFNEQVQMDPQYKEWRKDPKAFATRKTFKPYSGQSDMSRAMGVSNVKAGKDED